MLALFQVSIVDPNFHCSSYILIFITVQADRHYKSIIDHCSACCGTWLHSILSDATLVDVSNDVHWIA